MRSQDYPTRRGAIRSMVAGSVAFPAILSELLASEKRDDPDRSSRVGKGLEVFGTVLDEPKSPGEIAGEGAETCRKTEMLQAVDLAKVRGETRWRSGQPTTSSLI